MRILRLDNLADGERLLLQSAIFDLPLLVDDGLDPVSSTKDCFARLLHGERFVDQFEWSSDECFRMRIRIWIEVVIERCFGRERDRYLKTV